MQQARTSALERGVEGIAVIAAFATIPLTIIEWDHPSLSTQVVDWCIWAVFVVEAMVLLARRRRGDASRVSVGIAVVVVAVSCPIWSILATGLAWGQLIRLVQILRLARLGGVGLIGVPALRRVIRPGLVYLVAVTAMLILVAAGVFTIVEPSMDGSYVNGLWLAATTAATVGYGDLTPQTLLGRVTAIALMLAGIGLLSTLSASIAAAFIGQAEDETMKEMTQRLERVEALLEELLARR